MRKRDELTDPRSCMSKARDDEWTFVLLGRDAASLKTIREWVAERIALGLNQPDDPQIKEAWEWHAAVMDELNARRIALAERKARGLLTADEGRKFEALQAAFFAATDAAHPSPRSDTAQLDALEKRLNAGAAAGQVEETR